jgi:hypothetical protein
VADNRVLRTGDAEQVSRPLASTEIRHLIAELEATRWTGRPGYPIRSMVGMGLAKALYALPTWTRAVALVSEHAALRKSLGCRNVADVPSVYACYRFATKLCAFKPILDSCIASVLASLQSEMPDLGRNVAVDASDLPAYANGQRYVSKNGPERVRFSDPDASWGHRSAVSTRKGGGFYGYKVHAAVCTTTGLPVAWQVETARSHEASMTTTLLNAVQEHGFVPQTCAMDKGYDVGAIYDACEERGIRPLIPLRETPAVKAGKAAPPSCEHGTWTFAGSDTKRGASKWRCPTGECLPARGSRLTASTR